jgi:hypothetical protein
MTVNEIIEQYKNEVEWGNEYYTNNSDNGTAKFALYWRDYNTVTTVKDALKNVDSEVAFDLVELQKQARLVEGDMLDLISECCNAVYVPNVFYQENEVYGMTLGEVELQPEDFLVDAYKALNEEQKRAVDLEIDAYIADDGWVYLNLSYERWIAELDVELLTEKLKEKAA